MSLQTMKAGLMATILISVLLSLAAPSVALACSMTTNYEAMEFVDEEPQQEAEFPDPVVLEFRNLNRADRPSRWNRDSCGDLGTLSIEVIGYDDDFGLLFEFEGQSPNTFYRFEEAVRLYGDTIYEIWRDTETRSEPFDISVTAQWVDKYGRLGPVSDPVHISERGEGCGCSSVGQGPDPVAVLVVSLLLFIHLFRPREHLLHQKDAQK